MTPKPGLVDRHNAGAHRDMDVFTFIDSACALRPYFETCARIGLAHRGKDAQACFDALRVPGLLAEDAMRRATDGVNTLNDAALCALTALMADTQDTNAVRRGGEAGAAAMRETARALDGEIAAALEAGEIKQKIGQFKEKLTDWDGQMSAAGISPGGCADLLAMALLMAFCERDAAEG